VVKPILAHLELPTEPPPLAPARLLEQEDRFPDLGDNDASPRAAEASIALDLN
jgi:hypothetical protein